jgi:cysteine sulfinate desulfinase/cysteine desulfurase-like protein
MGGKGLYANIHAKRKRIKAGSGESMRRPGTKGAPTAKAFKKAAKTAKKPKK